MTETIVYGDAAALAQATAARLLLRIGDVLAHRERADVVLTGGTVGTATLAEAARSPLASGVDWTSVHLWWGDERFVAIGDPDRNEGQAQEALLSSLPLPEENIHRMGAHGPFATAEDAAGSYDAEIAAAGTPAWDVLLLGLGPDGHVASLFPGHPGFGDAGASALAVHDSPKPPPTRVSLSLAQINRAREVWLLAAGEAKANVAARCIHGDASLPGAAVHGTERTLWLLDAAAATRI
ncbi:6-phosphogluconolactonase [uncultured Demequina sp.]|uniref:6-phosphogluconolactonase n=1 Tax=uncultured Demequina sp. TaxID=693499 RepID=UPI0025D16A3C|nr:6-phosphogluconolactonase [uncultured Demequina sp.]